MWNRIKNLLVMDAPTFWDQPLDEFMDEQLAIADGRPLLAKEEPAPTPVIFNRRGKSAKELADMETVHEEMELKL